MSQKAFDKMRDVKAIILAGGCDFSRCPLASRVPTALWPVVDKPAIEHLLLHLYNGGVRRVVICSNSDSEMLKRVIDVGSDMDVKFLEEQLPSGTAGCIRDAASDETDALLLVFPGSIVSPPDINMLLRAHHNNKGDLTVVLNPSCKGSVSGLESTDIYLCEPAVLKHIPKDGYYDVKESLIPELLRAGKGIYAERLTRPVGNFRNREEYLFAVSSYLENAGKETINLPVFRRDSSQTLWSASDVEIDSGARICGPVVVMAGACISKGAVVLGPAIIGRNVSIGRESLVVNSVLWDGAQVGKNCEIQRCLIDSNAIVPSHSAVEEQVVPFVQKNILQAAIGRVAGFINDKTSELQSLLQSRLGKVGKRLNLSASGNPGRNIFAWFAAGLLLVAFGWSYWNGIIDLWDIWQRSDEYSSGLLVPFLVVYILWSRRDQITSCRIKPSLWGLFAFLAAQAFRLFGLFFMYSSAERLSIVISIAALVLMLFGWQLFRRVFTTLLFLGLMIPLPRSIHAAIMLPLQSWATSSAVFCLETLGYQVIREGNIINIGGTSVAVAEACNGLRMVMAFFIVGGLVVLLVRRNWWKKLIVLLSSIPIGLFCNSIRLTITAIAFTMLSGERWQKIFHDFGGYAMMPLALGVIVLELQLLAKITTAPPEKQIVSAGT